MCNKTKWCAVRRARTQTHGGQRAESVRQVRRAHDGEMTARRKNIPFAGAEHGNLCTNAQRPS